MDIEETSTPLPPPADHRPRMPEPPPVRVVAIEQVRLSAVAGLEKLVDAFYVGLLKFERAEEPGAHLHYTYKSATVPVVFDVLERPRDREDFRPLQVEIPHFKDFIQALNDAEMPFEWQKGITPGTDIVLVRDPAGNWVSVGAWTSVR